MKNLTVIIALIVFSLPAFAQDKMIAEKMGDKKTANNIVVLDFKLGAVLGGFKDGKFVEPKIAAAGNSVGGNFTNFGSNFGKTSEALKVTKIDESIDDICPGYYTFQTDYKMKSGVALSSNAGWNATPRTATGIDAGNRVYRGIVRKYIRTKGIKNPDVQIRKILKIDLEGDGVDEVLIHADNRKGEAGFETKFGDYSFVILRKIVNNKLETLLLDGEFITKNANNDIPVLFEPTAIADLNGDGIMEIVIYSAYYEGASSEVFSIENGKSVKVLETGCGV